MATAEMVKANDMSLVQYESASKQSVTLTPDIVRKQLVRGKGNVTDQEIFMFMRTCQARGLDPFENGEVYLIKYDNSNPAQMVVGYHAYAKRADAFPDYRGYSAGITVVRNLNGNAEVIQKEGQCVYKALGETLIGGWCRVRRERKPGYIEESFVEVSLDEYSSGQSNWRTKPATMIRKVAVSQALRQAFPNDYEGLYTIDEMDASNAFHGHYVDEETGEVTRMNSAIPAEKSEPEEDSKLTTNDRRELTQKLVELFGKEQSGDMFKVIVEQAGFNVTSTAELTRSQMVTVLAKAEEIAAKMNEGDEQTANGDGDEKTA
ncbi:MAG: phage recombination protein Bet [Clostridia bacterium]|nr:phage recombination protein Bet [Clostridia bacterium]